MSTSIDRETEITKALCIADTLHDFNKSNALNGNSLFENYKASMDTERYLTRYFNTSGTIERRVVEYFTKTIYRSIDVSKITIENFEGDFNADVNKPFLMEISDLSDDKFITILSAICAIQCNSVNEIKFVTDGTIIGSQDVICKLKYDNARGIMVESPSYIYDRGHISKEDYCTSIEKNRGDAEVNLLKAEGNLFGFDEIRCGIDANNNPNFETVLPNIRHTINLKTFCTYNNEKDTAKFASLFIDAIKATRTTNLFSKIKNMYGVDIKLPSSIGYDSNTVLNQIFDCKRAGDQMQVKYARKNNCIFISNDNISIAYAIKLGIPCIKTNKKGVKMGTERRPSELTFYNFNKVEIANKMFGIDYSIKILKKYIYDINKLRSFINTYITDANKDTVEKNLIQNKEISWIILKYYPVNIGTNRDIVIRLYQYQYLNFLNLVTCILIKSIIDQYYTNIGYVNKLLIYLDRLLLIATGIKDTGDVNSFNELKKSIKELESDTLFREFIKLISYVNINDTNNSNYLSEYIEIMKNYYPIRINDNHFLFGDKDKTESLITVNDNLLGFFASHREKSISIPIISLGIELININYSKSTTNLNIVKTTEPIHSNLKLSSETIVSEKNMKLHNKYIASFNNIKMFFKKIFQYQNVNLDDILISDNYNMKNIIRIRDKKYNYESSEEEEAEKKKAAKRRGRDEEDEEELEAGNKEAAKARRRDDEVSEGGRPQRKIMEIIKYVNTQDDAIKFIQYNKNVLLEQLEKYEYKLKDINYFCDFYELFTICLINILPIFDKNGEFLYLSDDRLYDKDFVNAYGSEFWDSLEIKEEYFKKFSFFGAKPKKETVAKPKKETVAKSKKETVAKPKKETVAKSKKATVAKPKKETVAKSKKETVAKPKKATVAKPKKETVAKPKKETVAKPKKETVAKPKKETVAKPKKETVAKPKKETVAKPKKETVAKPKKDKKTGCTIS